MRQIFTLLFFLLISLCGIAQELQYKVTADCRDTLVEVPEQAYKITVDAEDLDIKLIEYDYKSRFSIASERTLTSGSTYRLKTSKFYDLSLYACDSTCLDKFIALWDGDSVLYDDSEIVLAAEDSVLCSFDTIEVALNYDYWDVVHPNPTRNIEQTLINMSRAGLQPLKFFTVLGQSVSLERLKKDYRGVIVCEYARVNAAQQIEYKTVRIMVSN